MITAAQHAEMWQANEAARSDWNKVIHTKVWHQITEFAVSYAQSHALATQKHDHDVLLARNLKWQEGFLAAIKFLQSACDTPPPEEPPLEDYDDNYVKKLAEKRQQQH